MRLIVVSVLLVFTCSRSLAGDDSKIQFAGQSGCTFGIPTGYTVSVSSEDPQTFIVEKGEVSSANYVSGSAYVITPGRGESRSHLETEVGLVENSSYEYGGADVQETVLRNGDGRKVYALKVTRGGYAIAFAASAKDALPDIRALVDYCR